MTTETAAQPAASAPAQTAAQPAAQPAAQSAAQPAQPSASPMTQPVVVPLVASGSTSLAAPVTSTAAPAVQVAGSSVEDLRAELGALKAELEFGKLEAAVMPKIDPAHAKAAKVILASLPATGGLKARTTAAVKYFESEFKEWLVPDPGAGKTPATGTSQPGGASGGAVRNVVSSPQVPAQASSTPKPQPQHLVDRYGNRMF